MKKALTVILMFIIVFMVLVALKYAFNGGYNPSDIPEDFLIALVAVFGIEFLMPKVIKAIDR